MHLRGLALHLLDQFIERLRRVVAEHVAPFVHELVEAWVLAPTLSLEHLVEVAHHLAHLLHVLGRHVGHHLAHVLEEAIHHRLFELLQQFLVLLARLVVLELVLLQLLDLARRVLRQTVDLLLLALQPLSQGLLQPFHFIVSEGRGLLLAARLAGFLPLLRFAHLALRLTLLLGLARHLLVGRRRRLRPRTDLVQPVVQRVSFKIEDLVELPLDVVEDRGQVEALKLLPALLPKPLKQIAHAVGAITVGHTDTALHHVAQRLLEISEGE